MSSEPTDTESAHDESTPDPDKAEYPLTLYVTSPPVEQIQAAALGRAERWEQGGKVPYAANFEDRTRLHQLLTDRRVELLEEVVEHPFESIHALTNRLERDAHDVHDDPHLLAGYDVVHFERDGYAKRLYVSCDAVRIEVEFGLPRDEGSSSSAST